MFSKSSDSGYLKAMQVAPSVTRRAMHPISAWARPIRYAKRSDQALGWSGESVAQDLP